MFQESAMRYHSIPVVQTETNFALSEGGVNLIICRELWVTLFLVVVTEGMLHWHPGRD